MTSKPGPQPGVYLWRGREYHGMRAVAEAAGVTKSAVRYHLETHGNLDRLGAGQSRKGYPGWRSGNFAPVHKFGRYWPSQRALAREVGRPEGTVSWWIREGHDDRLLAALMAANARKTAAAMREAQMIDGHPKRRLAA